MNLTTFFFFRAKLSSVFTVDVAVVQDEVCQLDSHFFTFILNL